MNTHQRMSSLGGDARAKSLTPEQRSESARVAGLASAAKRKAKALGVVKPDTASRRWRRTRISKTLSKTAHLVTRVASSQTVPGPDLGLIPQRHKALFQDRNAVTTGAFGKSNGGKRAKANGGQWHDHRKKGTP